MKEYDLFFGPVEILCLPLLGFNPFLLLYKQFLPHSESFMERAITPSKLTYSPSFWKNRAQVTRSEKDPVIPPYPLPGDAELHPIICLPGQSLLCDETGHRTAATSFSDPAHTLPWMSWINWLLEVVYSFPTWKFLAKSCVISSCCCLKWCRLSVKGWLSTQMHTVPVADTGQGVADFCPGAPILSACLSCPI